MRSDYNEELQGKIMGNDIQGALEMLRPKMQSKCAKMYTTGEGIQNMDSDDVTQEILLKIFESIHLYDSSRSSFYTFSNRVAENKIKDLKKYENRQKRRSDAYEIRLDQSYFSESEEDNFGFIPSKINEINDSDFKVDFHVFSNLKLSETEKLVLMLRQKDMPVKKIARGMCVSESRISQIMSSIKLKWQDADYQEV